MPAPTNMLVGSPMKERSEGEANCSTLEQMAAEVTIVLSFAVAQELRSLVRAEVVQWNLVQQAGRSSETADIPAKDIHSRSCRVCRSSVSSTCLFCPKCNSFQGAVAAEQCHTDERQSQPGNLELPMLQGSGAHILRPGKWRQISIGITIAVAACLMSPSGVEVDGKLLTQTKSAEPLVDPAITTIDRLEVVPARKGIGVQIMSSRPIRPLITRVGDPPSIVIDLINTMLDTPVINIPIASQGVLEVRASQYRLSPPVTRVVVTLTAPLAYSVESKGNELALEFVDSDKASEQRR